MISCRVTNDIHRKQLCYIVKFIYHRRVSTRSYRDKLPPALTSELETLAKKYGCFEKHLLLHTVEPYFYLDYHDQLKWKQKSAEIAIKKFTNICLSNVGVASKKIIDASISNNGFACPVEAIKPSPVIEEYRNKDSYSVGIHVNGARKAVGFYVQSEYFSGVKVLNGKIKSQKPKHYELSKVYSHFLQSHPLDICHPFMVNGHWRNITVRSNECGKTMVQVAFHPQDASQSVIDTAKDDCYEYFIHGPGKSVGIDSLYFHVCTKVKYTSEGGPFYLLHGEPYLYEKLLDKKFRISPDAFFQLNTPAAEVLYSTIKSCAAPNKNLVILDICCGTGTIGITLANTARKVFGIDIIKQAIDDATFNADLNSLVNAEYFTGYAEKCKHILQENVQASDDVVAVVNPGRGGLGKSVTKLLRKLTSVRKVIFVSCKPMGRSCFNFAELCRAEDSLFPGEPFIPTRAIPVDMFPNMSQVELVVEFVR